ncbi:hypothetical protein GOV06_05870 [Candidatus Woesearchaeota archaeon]|nr:hypothetical protein [Candidatus Woesearchaeota archaeon]
MKIPKHVQELPAEADDNYIGAKVIHTSESLIALLQECEQEGFTIKSDKIDCRLYVTDGDKSGVTGGICLERDTMVRIGYGGATYRVSPLNSAGSTAWALYEIRWKAERNEMKENGK